MPGNFRPDLISDTNRLNGLIQKDGEVVGVEADLMEVLTDDTLHPLHVDLFVFVLLKQQTHRTQS